MTTFLEKCSDYDTTVVKKPHMAQLPRTATPADLPGLQDCALEFCSKSKHLKNFSMERFVAVWTGLIESGNGVIFLVGEPVIGFLGGVAYPDLYSDKLIASEFFWFVREGARGPGVALYRAFEAWAREMDCSEVRMVHLSDSMPERVAQFYGRIGYAKVETCYAKALVAA